MGINSTFFNRLENFVVIGSNFTKADINTRSRFAITGPHSEKVYRKAVDMGFGDFLLLSTCNRTEFYSCGSVTTLRSLVKQQLLLTDEDLDTYFYTYSGTDAIQHFFRVLSGLDSQIIGEYEIVNQVKSALKASRYYGLTGTISDRISNFALQASKEIKSETNLSKGKYSVSYAAAELMLEKQKAQLVEKVLIVGTGDFGRTVARNFRQYFPDINLSLTNRTQKKAQQLAVQLNANILPFETFKKHLHTFDAVITTIGTEKYMINPGDIPLNKPQLYLDLSVPQAINPRVDLITDVQLYSVDEISAFHNDLLAERMSEIPEAEEIIAQHIDRLLAWNNVHKHRKIILGYKEKIQNLVCNQRDAHVNGNSRLINHKIDKSFSELIQKIKTHGYAGCIMIEAMDAFVPAEK
jgi:glutamyl-tRNA reductase